ncbi:MAG: phage tail fiber domain-containing protein [Burkholderiales bacterium]
MTVSVTTPINNYTGNGSVTSFAYSFRILQQGDLHVYLDGVEQTTGFTVTGINSPTGGSVVFTTAPAAGVIVRLQRIVTKDRTTDYVEGGALPAQTLDDDFDRAVMQVQDLNLVTFQVASDDKWDALSKVIKNVATPVAGGDAVNKTYADSTIPANVAAAATSATNAASSATAAATSATNSASSATAAATSATNAASSATAAAASVAAAGLPAPVAGAALKFIRINAGETAYEFQTPAQVLADISAAAASHLHTGVYEPVDANIVRKNVLTIFTSQQIAQNGTLTDGATVNWDGNVNGQVVSITLGGSRTFAAPTNIQQYGLYVLRVTQDATGSRAISWNAAYKFGANGAPILTTTANHTDILLFVGGAAGVLEFTGARLDAV